MTSNEFFINRNGSGSVSVVIPVFNSEKTIGLLVDELISTYATRYPSFEIVLVDDGSQDSSSLIIREKVQTYSGIVKGVFLAKNFGEHNAVMCGLQHAGGNSIVIMDDDFQNPVKEVGVLLNKLSESFDVVYSFYGQVQQSSFRRFGSWLANWVACWTIGKPKSLYLSSFKAIRFSILKPILQYQGPFPYIDGLILRSTANIGQIQVQHQPRSNGKSNYNLLRLVYLWLNMVTGFSIFPLRVVSFFGLVFSVLGIVLGLFFTYVYFQGPVFIHNHLPPGWASLIVTVTVFGGIQLIVLGLIGEYLGRLFLTVNKIPQFVVRETKGF